MRSMRDCRKIIYLGFGLLLWTFVERCVCQSAMFVRRQVCLQVKCSTLAGDQEVLLHFDVFIDVDCEQTHSKLKIPIVHWPIDSAVVFIVCKLKCLELKEREESAAELQHINQCQSYAPASLIYDNETMQKIAVIFAVWEDLRSFTKAVWLNGEERRNTGSATMNYDWSVTNNRERSEKDSFYDSRMECLGKTKLFSRFRLTTTVTDESETWVTQKRRVLAQREKRWQGEAWARRSA